MSGLGAVPPWGKGAKALYSHPPQSLVKGHPSGAQISRHFQLFVHAVWGPVSRKQVMRTCYWRNREPGSKESKGIWAAHQHLYSSEGENAEGHSPCSYQQQIITPHRLFCVAVLVRDLWVPVMRTHILGYWKTHGFQDRRQALVSRGLIPGPGNRRSPGKLGVALAVSDTLRSRVFLFSLNPYLTFLSDNIVSPPMDPHAHDYHSCS